MIKTRLLRVMGKRQILDILQEIIWRYLGLLAQLVLVGCIAILISDYYYDQIELKSTVINILIVYLCFALRVVLVKLFYDAKISTGMRATRTVRGALFKKLFELGNTYGEKNTNMNLAELLTEGVDLVENYYSQYLVALAYAVLGSLTMIICIGLIDPMIALVITAGGLFYIIAFTIIRSRENYYFLKYIIAILESIAFVATAMGFTSAIKNLTEDRIELQYVIILFYLCIEAYVPLIDFSKDVLDGDLGLSSVIEIKSFLNTRAPKEGSGELSKGPIRVVLDNVSFGYGGKGLLKDISMTIKPNTYTCILGEKETGKTTLAGILNKKNRAYMGSIKINGVELSNLSEDQLMDRMVCLNAETYILRTTIRENLLMANSEATDKKMINALVAVKLWPEIKDKGGLEATLEALDFSEGQKKRLAFARALLKNADIYLFDDFLNNIDGHSWIILSQLISQLSIKMGKTVVFFSENIEDFVNADVIYQLSGGEMDEYREAN